VARSQQGHGGEGLECTYRVIIIIVMHYHIVRAIDVVLKHGAYRAVRGERGEREGKERVRQMRSGRSSRGFRV